MPADPWAPGQVVVKIAAPPGKLVASAQVETIAARYGQAGTRSLLPETIRIQRQHGELDSVFILDYGNDAGIEQLIDQLSADPDVVYAEPNVICRAAETPDDPFYMSDGAWGQTFADMWGLHRIGLGPVGTGSGWDIETGFSHPVIVGIIDTGLDHNHPDIAGQAWINPNEIPDDGIDNDNNGYVDDVVGWNFVDDNGLPVDGHGHGTHCAGTIAAATNNGLGVAGASWGATIMPIKGLSDGGIGSSTALANSIIYAADNGAKILSNSWGGAAASPIQVMIDACDYATAQGCLVIAAAGNAANDLFPPHPGSYPSVMAVAATNPDDTMAWFTNYGSFVEISAPGANVLSLRADETDMYGDGEHIVDEHYYRASGTSMACPHTAGVAALVWSAHPDWTADDVREQLHRTADDIEPVNPDYINGIGGGCLNAHSALSLTARPLVRFRNVRADDTSTTHVNQAIDPGETVSLIVSIRNAWLPASDVTATLTTADAYVTILDDTVAYGAVDEYEMDDGDGDVFTVTVDPSCPMGHEPAFDLQIDADGYIWNDTMTVRVALPEPEIRGLFVHDPTGDNDREIDAGEQCQLIVRLGNGTHAGVARNVTASAGTNDPYLTITDAHATFPDAPAGEVVTNRLDPFAILLDAGFPSDHIAHIELSVTGEGFSDVLDVEITLTRSAREFSEFIPIPIPMPINPCNLDVAIDNEDRIHAVWTHPDYDYGYMVAYRSYEHLQWHQRQYKARGGGTHIELDPAGAPHFSWNQYAFVDGYAITLVAAGIYYQNAIDGWSGIENVTNTPGELENNCSHSLAIDSQGNIHIVWLYYDYDNGGLVDVRLNHSVRINGAWQEPTPIVIHPTATWYTHITLLATSDDQLWLFYRFNSSNPVLSCRTWDGTTWTDRRQVPTDGLTIMDLDVELAHDDKPNIVYRAGGDDLPIFTVRKTNSGWSTPRPFPDIPEATRMDTPRIYIDPADTVHVQWKVRTHPGDYYVDNIYTQRRTDDTWSEPEALTDFPHDVGQYLLEHEMVMDSLGRRHLFYISSLEGLYHLMVDSAYEACPADFDNDGDVDQADFGHLQLCLSGAGVPTSDPQCENAHLDDDEDVDLDDFGIFQSCMSGADVLADMNCSD